jgi:hypothetical protein
VFARFGQHDFLFFAELKKPFASLLQFIFEADFLQQELNDLELVKLPARLVSSIASDS